MASNYLCVAGDIPNHTQRGSCGSNTHLEPATWVWKRKMEWEKMTYIYVYIYINTCLEIGYTHNYSTIYSHLPSGHVNIAIENDHL